MLFDLPFLSFSSASFRTTDFSCQHLFFFAPKTLHCGGQSKWIETEKGILNQNMECNTDSLNKEICKKAVALNLVNIVAFGNAKSSFFWEGCILSTITMEIMISHVKSVRSEHS